jgi:hypothetical protein
MDLFTPLVPEADLHPNFRRLLDKHSEADRQVLKQWSDGFFDRDGKFIREFQTTFNSGFWELYIFACCKEMQFNVDFAFGSPDFVINNFHREFCIEAVIASNALGEEAEWERDLQARPDLEAVLDTAVIRLSNAIQSKYKKYLDFYHALPQVKGNPFVLAVGPFEQPSFWAHNDHAIRQVLYGYDRIGPDGKHQFRKVISKPSGSTIELGLFTCSKMPEISAVLFSNTATMSKVHALNSEVSELMWFSALRFNHHGPQPYLQNASKVDYRESLLDGLYVFHNPHAHLRLDARVFNHDDITQATLVGDSLVPRYKCKHGHLIQRSSMQIRARD